MRKLRFTLVVLTSLGSTALLACGSGDSSSGPPPDGGNGSDVSFGTDGIAPPFDAAGIDAGTLGAFCEGVYGAYLGAWEACCTAADRATAEYAFLDGILRYIKGLCETNLAGSLADGRIQYDGAEGQTCIGAIQSLLAGYTCNGSFPSGGGSPGAAAACKGAIVGQQPAGAPCQNDYECLDGLTCIGFIPQRGGTTTDGVCSQPPGTGQACGAGQADGGGGVTVHWSFGNHPDCVSGDYCSFSKCAVQSGPGGNCGANDECTTGLTCIMSACSSSGPAPAGGNCQATSDCQSGLYCQSTDAGQSCQPKLPAGSTCGGGFLGGNGCKGTCVVPDGGTTGTCASFCGSG
jgi:hypothetical protein